MNYSHREKPGERAAIMDWRKPPEPSEQIAGERRSDRRYDISLELRWKVLRRKRTLDSGLGRTVDLSSGGILFETGRKLPVGLKVQLSIAWPVLAAQRLAAAVDGVGTGGAIGQPARRHRDYSARISHRGRIGRAARRAVGFGASAVHLSSRGLTAFRDRHPYRLVTGSSRPGTRRPPGNPPPSRLRKGARRRSADAPVLRGPTSLRAGLSPSTSRTRIVRASWCVSMEGNRTVGRFVKRQFRPMDARIKAAVSLPLDQRPSSSLSRGPMAPAKRRSTTRTSSRRLGPEPAPEGTRKQSGKMPANFGNDRLSQATGGTPHTA